MGQEVKAFLASFCAGCGLILALAACPAAVPGVSCVACVLADALKGDSIAQILADCGPTCVTSAEEIVTILIGSDDPRIPNTPAYHEAMARRKATQ